MKTNSHIVALFAFILFSMIAENVNAQTITGVHAFTTDLKAVATSDDGHYSVIASNKYYNPNGEVVIIDHLDNNNVVQQVTITPGGSGNNWGIDFFTQATIDNDGNAYVSYKYHTRADNIVEMRIDKMDINGNITTVFELGGAGTHAMKATDNAIFIMLSSGVYGFDPMNSGLPYFDDYLFVSIDTATNGINYTQEWDETFYDITETADGNLLVSSYDHYWKLDSNNGSVLVDNIKDGDDVLFCDDGDIIIKNNGTSNASRRDWNGNIITQSDFGYSFYNRTVKAMKRFGNKYYYVTQSGLGQIVLLEKSMVNENHDFIHKKLLRPPSNVMYLTTDNSVFEAVSPTKILGITESTVTAVARYQNGPWDFHGNILPDTNNNWCWFVYTYAVEIDESQYISVNNINTHNIVGVYNNAVVNENGNVVNEDIQEAVVLFASESDIPAEGTDLSSWGLWTYNGGIVSQDAPFLNKVRVNDNGKYVDVAGMDPIGDGTNPWMKKYTDMRIYLMDGSTVGVGEQEITNINIYPNPANDVVNIEVEEGQRYTNIELFDTQGKVIRKINLQNNLSGHIQVSLTGIPAGLYTVKLTGNITTQYIKLLVE